MSTGEEEGAEAEDDSVISPIARAFGYSREKKESGDENANPIARQIASNEPDDEVLDLSLLEKSQPFEEESYQNEEKGSYVFAIIVMAVAVGIAAVLAHVSGKAAWLQ